MQALTNEDGTGRLFVNTAGGPWRWEACDADLRRCRSFGAGREIDTGAAGPGTVFRVRGEGMTGTSPEWRGRLRQLGAPKVLGAVQANDFVSPLPGKWAGGWEGEFSELQLAACATPASESCTTLTHVHYVRRCAPGSSFALKAEFAGRFLRVAHRRLGAGPPLRLAYAVTSPHGGKVLRPSRSTSVAVVGQIGPAIGPYPGECGPPPPAHASISSRGVASVECLAGCRAALIARRDGREVGSVVRKQLSSWDSLTVPPPLELRLPARALAGLRPGRVAFVVEIDGKRAARRVVRLAP